MESFHTKAMQNPPNKTQKIQVLLRALVVVATLTAASLTFTSKQSSIVWHPIRCCYGLLASGSHGFLAESQILRLFLSTKRSPELTRAAPNFSDFVSKTTKKSKGITARAPKKADQIKVEAFKKADQIKSLTDLEKAFQKLRFRL